MARFWRCKTRTVSLLREHLTKSTDRDHVIIRMTSVIKVDMKDAGEVNYRSSPYLKLQGRHLEGNGVPETCRGCRKQQSGEKGQGAIATALRVRGTGWKTSMMEEQRQGGLGVEGL